MPGVRLKSSRPWVASPPLRSERGQSSVELVALLPLALLLGLAVMALLESRSTAAQAAAAAHAGAMAMMQDADGERAARAALPEGARRRATISVRGRRVTVTVRAARQPPFVDGAFATTASASADPGRSP